MKKLIAISLLVWWFAVIDKTGAIQYFEYRTENKCIRMHNLYMTVPGLKVTMCEQKELA